MFMRNLTGTGDWRFGHGIADFVFNEQAVELNIQTRVLEWLGDCFFNILGGVDWMNLLDVGQQANLDVALRSIIVQSYGVVNLQTINVNFSGRTRLESVNYSVQTIYSQGFQSEINTAAGTGL